MKRDDFLIEILTEELPPKALAKLADAFRAGIEEGLQKAGLAFTKIKSYATPRRLAVLVEELAAEQPDQMVERRGPAKSAAFDAEGHPSKACIGFARSCGVAPESLITISNDQGEWVGFRQHVRGKSVSELMPEIAEQSIATLPIPKRMRWGEGDSQFVRPVLSVIMLYGDQVMDATLLGCPANRVTRGHRFHAPEWITIPHAAAYESLLETEGYVVADFVKRRQLVRQKAVDCVNKELQSKGEVYISSDAFLDEVTGLVEWPVALCGKLDSIYLKLPEEVLISSMEDHQRYFPVKDHQGKLLPYFVTISNIQSHEPQRVIHGNERVLRARLADAAFFYDTDQKESLAERVERLKGIIFQAKLGTLYEKAERISKLAAFIAQKTDASIDEATRAGMLAKTDLTTNMVGEFPELQGVMGYYYAIHDGESDNIAKAMKEHYLPRFAGDRLPENAIGQALSIADRVDTLTGAFGIHQIPTGDKDPYGLRRAALGILRILIEKTIDLDLKPVMEFAASCYEQKLSNPETVQQVLAFIQERMRSWCLESGVPADVFAAVAAIQITNPYDAYKRIKAVQSFKQLNEAEALSVANKRVSNILAKYADTIDAKQINRDFFENESEQELARQLEFKSRTIEALSQSGNYNEILLQLAELRQPVDDFFDHVMVMTEDKARRENRILLLGKLRALFLQVADIALLQS
ncbi:glycine--tRNA ligase subunit beta [Aquicella lusitana]|uniref:Glycine--tRNA ligase beta subunit n=1 Tax=Aquicella lusitana TaxID=254246 RepID=A0A370GTA1_9COXI|nr:glycine--tRNA ligase subunit beta [Aquicella lusitana]RDI46486.1 glycyl-tRNA synthetase beta chain [Aquicella lusitana]VVC74150.1 Glycine--tRNA ligase beta subunit [Aquicella lusitana]